MVARFHEHEHDDGGPHRRDRAPVRLENLDIDAHVAGTEPSASSQIRGSLRRLSSSRTPPEKRSR